MYIATKFGTERNEPDVLGRQFWALRAWCEKWYQVAVGVTVLYGLYKTRDIRVTSRGVVTFASAQPLCRLALCAK